MTNIEAISWPKDFPELKRLDNLLRCGICYDYMKTPMMTSCSHNYCSFCIRKYMQYKTTCPTCFEETFEVTLRNNRSLDDVISLFTGIRDKIIRHLKLAAIHTPKASDSENCVVATHSPSRSPVLTNKISNNKLNHNEESSVKGKSVVRRLDKDASKDSSVCGVAKLTSPVTSKLGETSNGNGPVTPVTKIPSIFYSPKKSCASVSPAVATSAPTVSCPVCSVDIPERNINVHLDSCLARVNSPPKCSPKISKRSPIPKRVYNMMSEKDLRKWLKNYGLSSIGDKKALINRLQRYTVLYNSECDSDCPRQVAEIIRQVEKEEKDEKVASSNLGFVRKTVNRNADQGIIDEENKKYIQKNKSHFESLINSMRERNQKYIKPTRPNNRIESDSDPEDSYSCKETERITDNPGTSNGKSHQYYNPKINGFIDDADVIDLSPESPDLSCNLKDSNIKSEKQDSNIFTSSSHIEAEVYINEDFPLASVKTEGYNKQGSSLGTCSNSHLESHIPDSSQLAEGKEKEEEEDDSEDSNESISLLACYENAVEENMPSACKPLTFTRTSVVPQSQIDDPDFMLTASEMIASDVSQESQDVFVSNRRSKRKHSEKAEYDLPKRNLRSKRTN